MTRVLTTAEREEVAVDRERDRVAWNLPHRPEAIADASLGSPAAAKHDDVVVQDVAQLEPEPASRGSTAAGVPQFIPGGTQQSYAEGRRARLRRGRIVGFALSVPLLVLGLVPLARESMDGRAGADAVLVYLAVGVVSLGIAVAIRGVYVLLTKRRFWSPWVFVLAAVLAIAGYAVQSAGEEAVPLAAAPVEQPTAG